ncbi:Alpha-acetolactate decarboxylase [Methanosarcina lacustris Z-7289]|uniref:Alpha-acetolactate decarboxylase n=1 Tax=Methanosarcina lacustris Z-7289 TaxID=1434111 RepID=A0A0E3WRQ7_9EURY|nr:acetolactate decarboxylase [Methanosarcina lacustris]AKB75485.1 Alpha-acetolactate decarboxylase [Methanosarcina lacustris Z-7289]
MTKKILLIVLIVLSVTFVSGCTNLAKDFSEKFGNIEKPDNIESSAESASDLLSSETDVLYQVSTIDALLQGVYDGVLPVAELATHGDFGIGTFDGLEGEMLALDGNYYQIKTDGIAYPVSGEMLTPFAIVTYFEADENFRLEKPVNLTELENFLDLNLPSENLFYAVRVNGNFSYIKARSVPRQEKPYPKLADAVSTQSVFEFENISGTLVGFKAPEYVKGVNVPGYHLHFITEDRNAGGHVLDFEMENGDAAIDITSEFFMELPTSGDFYNVKLGQDLQNDMEKVEK